jgi:hypothetical protein
MNVNKYGRSIPIRISSNKYHEATRISLRHFVVTVEIQLAAVLSLEARRGETTKRLSCYSEEENATFDEFISCP